MEKLNDNATDKDNVKFECERDWRLLRNAQVELQNIEPIAVVSGDDIDVNNDGDSNNLTNPVNVATRLQILHEHEKRLKAELQILRERRLRTPPDNESLQLLIVEQDQIKRLDHLKDTLIYSRAVRSEVLEDIKQQEETYSSLSSLNSTLKEKIAAVKQLGVAQETGGTLEAALSEITTKVAKVTEMDKYFKDILTRILSKYFPVQHHKSTENILDKSEVFDMNNMLSLKSIIGKLIEKSLNSPEQPYIDINERFWPPHIEFLLRCQIVLKDPNNSHRMKLVPFHL